MFRLISSQNRHHSFFVCYIIWLLIVNVGSFTMKSNLHRYNNYNNLWNDDHRREPKYKRYETRTQHSNNADEIDTDYVGAGTLGDIMSDEDHMEQTNESAVIDHHDIQGSRIVLEESSNSISPTKSGLVTQVGGTLQSQFGAKVTNLSPLDRIALTSNGNLQRIFSSYYDAPVHVHVDSCVKRQLHPTLNDNDESSDVIWDRKVRLIVFDQIFCTATSVITVHSPDCVEMVNSGKVGLGQLFRFLDKLPTFTILDAGTTECGGLWRKYRLECAELTCDILEEFVPNAWELKNKS